MANDQVYMVLVWVYDPGRCGKVTFLESVPASHRPGIGRVTYSKTGATIYYQGKEFRSLKGAGFKANYYEVATGDEYWISGPCKDGQDSLYATNIAPEIDVDVSDEYWSQIRTPAKP